MKLFIVNRHKDTILGGSEIQCDIIARYFTKVGVEVIYIAMQSSHSFNLSYKVIPLQAYSPIAFGKLLKEHKPDVVYWRYNKINLKSAVRVSHINGIKFIFSLSNVNDVSKWHWNWEPSLTKPLYSVKQLFSSIKNSVRSFWNHLAYYEIDGVVSLQDIFIPMLPQRFNETNAISIHNSMEFLPSCSFQWAKPYVVWVANLKPNKRPEVYIHLAKEFENDGVDFLLIGKIQDPAYNYVNDTSLLPKNLHYLGLMPVHDVDAILQNSLFMVHTCIPEGFGNNFIQAWFAAKPTISLSFDPDHLIETHQLGYISYSYQNLVEHTRQLIQDEPLRKDMGERSRALANELFVPEKNSEKLYQFITALVNN